MEYSERAPHYTWLVALMNLLALGFVFLFVYLYVEQVQGWLAFFIVSPLMIWGALAFSNMHFELDHEAVTAWLWPFRSRIPYAEIVHVGILKKIPWWTGLGLHMFDNTWWYSSRYGKAVVIKRKSKGINRVVMTTKDPEQFAAMVKERVKKAK